MKILLTSPSHGFFFKEDFYKHYGFDIYDDLKRLVESHELVEKHGGLIGAKEYLKGNFIQYHMSAYARLKQAILDVESCQ